MRWSSRPRDRAAPAVMVGTAVLLALLVFDAAVSGFSEEKRLSVYSGTASYSLTVREQNGAEYVGLLEILSPLGSVSAYTDGGVWRLSFDRVDGEFTPGKTRARVRGKNFDLPANFWLENGHGLVPLSSLPGLMQRFLGTAVNFHESSRRLFIGNVAVHFTAQVNRTNPPTLVMNFTSPVNPTIATEPGKLRMVFTREPLVPPGSQTLTFDSPSIPSATFQESNGAAEIAVNGPVPLFASFSNNGHTITITPAPQPAVERAGSGRAARQLLRADSLRSSAGNGNARDSCGPRAIFRGRGRKPWRGRAGRCAQRPVGGKGCHAGFWFTPAAATAGARNFDPGVARGRRNHEPGPARKHDQRGSSGNLHLPACDLPGRRSPPLYCVASGGQREPGTIS